jgi:hypothetical protein
MMVGRLAWRSGLAVCLLAGCAEKALAPAREAGVPPPTGTAPPGMTIVDAGTPPATVDAATPPTSVDAGADAGPVVRLARTKLLTSADLSTAVVLAADTDGIYWVTLDNQLWMLPTGGDSPRQLAADPSPTNFPDDWACLFVRGGELFWTAEIFATSDETYYRSPLHRTDKTGEDVVLVPAFGSCDLPAVAADDRYLYFPGGDVAVGRAEVVALALDAEPGTAPTPLATLSGDLDIASMAVDDDYLYWTTYPIDSTVQIGAGAVTRGDKASLLAGLAGSSDQLVSDWASALWPVGDDLYFVYTVPWKASWVGRIDASGTRVNLPLPGGNTLLVFADWAVTATIRIAPPKNRMFAAATGAVAGDGSVAVEIADDVLVAPVIGSAGLIFVDGGGHLLAVSAQDLGAAVAAGQR